LALDSNGNRKGTQMLSRLFARLFLYTHGVCTKHGIRKIKNGPFRSQEVCPKCEQEKQYRKQARLNASLEFLEFPDLAPTRTEEIEAAKEFYRVLNLDADDCPF